MTPHGHSVQYEDRAIAFNLTGVGSGAAKCIQTATIPIAIQFEDKPATLEHLKSNVATGSGADLPSIMGKISATAKDSVVLLREGKEQLVFPGPGGYKIEWSPGTKIMDPKSAPSGHLVFNCDIYDEVTTDRAPQMVFVTDYTNNLDAPMPDPATSQNVTQDTQTQEHQQQQPSNQPSLFLVNDPDAGGYDWRQFERRE